MGLVALIVSFGGGAACEYSYILCLGSDGTDICSFPVCFHDKPQGILGIFAYFALPTMYWGSVGVVMCLSILFVVLFAARVHQRLLRSQIDPRSAEASDPNDAANIRSIIDGEFAFLPITIDGRQTLAKVGVRNGNHWQAVGRPHEPTPGLAFRRSKRLEDRGGTFLPWGCAVEGVDTGDGWIRIRVTDGWEQLHDLLMRLSTPRIMSCTMACFASEGIRCILIISIFASIAPSVCLLLLIILAGSTLR